MTVSRADDGIARFTFWRFWSRVRVGSLKSDQSSCSSWEVFFCFLTFYSGGVAMSGVMKIAAFIAAILKKHRGLVTGATIYHGGNFIFNNPLWLSVELMWGVKGVIGMMASAFVIDAILLIYFSNNRGTDFILWNKLDEFSGKKLKFTEVYNKWAQKKTPWRFYKLVIFYVPVKLTLFILWCFNKSPRLGDLVAFLILSIHDNAFSTTMYLRHGYRGGLRIRDYVIFFVSSVITIGYWAARNAVIVELLFRPTMKLF